MFLPSTMQIMFFIVEAGSGKTACTLLTRAPLFVPRFSAYTMYRTIKSSILCFECGHRNSTPSVRDPF